MPEPTITITLPLTPNLSSLPKRILAGMLLIRKYEPNADIAAEHDVIYFGGYETREKMTEEEKQLMEAWRWREEFDSWCHSV